MYYRQLDSLRALAALAVFVHHFLEESWLISLLPLGDLGVRLFFVLSGFLITSQLLHSKKSMASPEDRKRIFSNFYIRRFFRLLPIYFLYLLLLIAFLPNQISDSQWFFSYLQNIYFALKGDFSELYLLRHFWTLAIEEQFYIFWPLIIIFTPIQYMRPVLIFFILFAPITRALLFSAGFSQFSISMLPSSHFDTLALGALLGFLVHSQSTQMNQLANYAGITGFLLLLVVLASKVLGMGSAIELVFGSLGAGLLFTYCINCCRIGVNGFIGSILNNSILVYLGKISYGMYVYHLLVQYVIVNSVGNPWSLTILGLDIGAVVVLSIASILVSMLSWHLYESPLNRLKARFTQPHNAKNTESIEVLGSNISR